MPRVLYWNVNNFSDLKINDPANPMQAADRLAYMQYVLTHQNADIIVIAEVTATNDFPTIDGSAARAGNGRLGALNLLGHLRAWQPGNNWMMVPMLNLGSMGFRECVAVYFNSNILEFTGPYNWTNNEPIFNAGFSRSVAPGAAPLGNYGAVWAGCLPGGAVDANSNYNPGVNQDQCAAQFQYFDPATGNEIFFPYGRAFHHNINPPYSRAPFLTTFYEPATGHNYKIFSIHTSPATANDAVQNFGLIDEMTNVGLDEVIVVVGDFNLDTYDNNNLGANGYGVLTVGFNFEILIDSMDAGAITAARRPFTMTHLLPLPNPPNNGVTERATPYSTSVPPGQTPNAVGQLPAAGDSPGGPYPSFGYMGSMSGFGFNQVSYAGSIDNALVLYDPAMMVPPHNTTIINPMVDMPYMAAGAPPANAPAGFYGYNQQLVNPIVPIPAGVNRAMDMAPHPLLTQFHAWNNYEKIRDTSDHLAIIFDI